MRYLFTILLVLMCGNAWGEVVYEMPTIQVDVMRIQDSEGHIHLFKPVVVEDCIETGWYEIVDGMGNRSLIRQAEEPCKKYHRLEWQYMEEGE